MLGSNVLQSLNGSVNAVWVGRVLGEEALAATSNANLVMFLILGTIFGVGLAATILVGQAFGRRDLDRARRVVGTGAAFFAGISTVMAVGGYLLTDEILALLGTPGDARPLAAAYLRVIFIAVPFMNAFSLLMTVLRGAGDSRTPFLFMGLAVALDIVLNPLLILGVGPLPRLGIAGSATATLVSQAIGLAALLTLLYARKHPLRLSGPDLRYLRPDPAILRALVGKGVPMGLQMIVISSASLMLMGLVNGYGSRTAAAYGVAAQLWSYVQMPALAIGAAVSSMAAQNIGAGRWDRVNRITGAGVLFNIALTGSLVALLYAVDEPLLRLFLPTDAEAVATAMHVNRIVAWSFVLFGVMIVLFATVRANGAVTPPLLILTFSIMIVRVPFAYALQERWGADAVWWSFPLGFALAASLAVAYHRFGNWRAAKMIEDRPPVGEPPDTGLGTPRERAL